MTDRLAETFPVRVDITYRKKPPIDAFFDVYDIRGDFSKTALSVDVVVTAVFEGVLDTVAMLVLKLKDMPDHTLTITIHGENNDRER